MTAASFLRDPVFRAGLLFRLALVALVVPQIQASQFVPFVLNALRSPALDPWASFVATGGDAQAYPYGPAMLLAHLPGTALGAMLGFLFRSPQWAGAGFRLGLLAADLITLDMLRRLVPSQPRRLLWLYWWSPVVLYVTYWTGQTDIVPIALLLAALLCVRQFHAGWSGAMLGLAFAAKLSMVLALPFMAIYLWRNKRLRALLPRFAIGYLLAVALTFLPWLGSTGFRSMVLGTPESRRVFDFAIPLGRDLHLYLTPLLFLLAVYGVWRLRRISFDLLTAVIGVSFFLVVLATPAPPGWYLWLVPFLVIHQLQSDRSAVVLTAAFSALMIAMHLIISPGAAVPGLGIDLPPDFALLDPHIYSLWTTLIVAMGLVLLAQMLRERIARNDYYRIGQKPLTVGVAGDSGSGKDTLSRALAGLFGEHSVVHVSGDDYHVWDRHAPMWQGLTHLNPRANDLRRFNNDVLALMDGKPIVCRQYDHSTGRFREPTRLDRNDVIIASGLHALHMPQLRQRFDVCMFLDVDEGLRRAWKIHRDVHHRGHDRDTVLGALERRAEDSRRYIHPQRNMAGLVLRLMPVNPRHLETQPPDRIRLKLLAVVRHGVSHERVARLLIGVCGLHLDVEMSDQTGDVQMTIEGDVAAEDIALAARTLVPGLMEMLDVTPRWEDGVTGIMQLLVLVQIEESLKNRIR